MARSAAMIKIPSAVVISEARRRAVMTWLNDDHGRRATDHDIAIIAAVVGVINMPVMPVAAAQDRRQGSKKHQGQNWPGHCSNSISCVHGFNLLLSIRLI